MQYLLTITRTDGSGDFAETEKIYEKTITADEVIQMMRPTVAAEPVIEKKAGKNKGGRPAKPKPTEAFKELEAQESRPRKGSVSDEDKALVMAEFKAGARVPAVYEKYGEKLGVSGGWFYALRAEMKKNHEITE